MVAQIFTQNEKQDIVGCPNPACRQARNITTTFNNKDTEATVYCRRCKRTHYMHVYDFGPSMGRGMYYSDTSLDTVKIDSNALTQS